MIYYLHAREDATLRGTTASDARNAAAIRRWLTAAMLNNVFSGASDNVLRETRRVIRERMEAGEEDFPAEALDRRIAELGRATGLGDAMIDEVLSFSYGNRRAFLALTLLYNRKDWGLSGFHQYHIIPRSLFTDERLREAGAPEKKWEHLKGLKDRLGNLELLLPEENVEKSAKDFAEGSWVSGALRSSWRAERNLSGGGSRRCSAPKARTSQRTGSPILAQREARTAARQAE